MLYISCLQINYPRLFWRTHCWTPSSVWW